jgi:hypothetical protein
MLSQTRSPSEAKINRIKINDQLKNTFNESRDGGANRLDNWFASSTSLFYDYFLFKNNVK